MKYLHFMMDQFYSREFIEEIQSYFNIREHQFVIMKKKKKNMYINPEEYQNIRRFTISREKKLFRFIISHIKFYTKEYIRIRNLMKKADYIFIHNLTEEMSGLLFRFKGKAKILWLIWGFDLYNYIPLNLFDLHTSKLMNKLDNKILLMFIRFYYVFYYNIRKSVIKRLDYVISAHQGDVNLLKKYFKTKAKCFSQNLYPNPVDFEKIDKKVDFKTENYNFKKNGDKLLLLGNSGTPTNNHLDLMIRLSEMKEQNFKIICPLSYGDSIYIKKIIENGKRFFGDRFVPLLEFSNPDIYYHILKQIDLAIMYHNRQQGMGNIQILVYLGKPLCMKKTSAFFNLVKRGVFVFPTQDLEKLILNEIEFTEVMSRNNKNIASQYFSVKSARYSIENLLNLIEE